MRPGRSTPSLVTRVVNHAVQLLPIGACRRVFYLRAHHRRLPLDHPVRFSEKLNWRMVFDHRELIVMACDKLAMKRYAAERVGADRLRIPQTLWSGTDVGELADVALPARWVMKPNAGTGNVHFGSGPPDLRLVRRRAARWLADDRLERRGEWGYGRARRAVLVEEAVDGDVPTDLWDWKFFVFHGVPVLVQLDSGRADEHRRRLYTPQWEPLPYRCGLPLAAPVDRPEQLAELLQVAADLGAEFDHIRVDLYLERGEIWFGEFTPYSGGGLVPFDPDDLDLALGAAWTLPDTGHQRTPAVPRPRAAVRTR